MDTTAANDKPTSGQMRLGISAQKIAELCRRYHIRRLAFFGSVLRADFRREGDVDILVEFEPDHVPGLGLIRIEKEISALLGGRRVDLVTEKFLHPRIRSRVLKEAEVQYVTISDI